MTLDTAELTPAARFGAAALGAPPPYTDPGEQPGLDAPRRRWPRRLMLSGLAVGLVLAALFGGRMWGQSGRTTVWMLTRGVPADSALQPGELRSVSVSKQAAATAISTSTPLDALVGKVAVRSLTPGQLLLRDSLGSTKGLPAEGQSLVGVSLGAGSAPVGQLRAGDRVAVVELPQQSTPGSRDTGTAVSKVLLRDVRLLGLAGSGSGDAIATLAVPDSAIITLTALSAAGRVALVLQH